MTALIPLSSPLARVSGTLVWFLGSPKIVPYPALPSLRIASVHLSFSPPLALLKMTSFVLILIRPWALLYKVAILVCQLACVHGLPSPQPGHP